MEDVSFTGSKQDWTNENSEVCFLREMEEHNNHFSESNWFVKQRRKTFQRVTGLSKRDEKRELLESSQLV